MPQLPHGCLHERPVSAPQQQVGDVPRPLALHLVDGLQAVAAVEGHQLAGGREREREGEGGEREE